MTTPVTGEIEARLKALLGEGDVIHMGCRIGYSASAVRAVMLKAYALDRASGDGVRSIKDAINSRLNDYLCEMKPHYDDSIVGFNEAWDIVRKVFDERASLSAVSIPRGEVVVTDEMINDAVTAFYGGNTTWGTYEQTMMRLALTAAMRVEPLPPAGGITYRVIELHGQREHPSSWRWRVNGIDYKSEEEAREALK